MRISTIDTVTSGHIFVDGKDITALHGSQLADFRGKKLGFIFQDFNLLDTLNAYENISLSLSIAGVNFADLKGNMVYGFCQASLVAVILLDIIYL